MDAFLIQGGVPLRGEVAVSGAKNAALPLLAATLLADGPCRLLGVPDLRDVATMARILERLGVTVERGADGTWTTTAASGAPSVAPRDLVKTMRASISVLGPLLGRRGEAEVSFPGGCVIGPRPIDLHLKGLVALGARIEVAAGYIRAHLDPARAGNERQIFLGGPFGPTVTGTLNVLSAAVLVPGTTILEAAACEPEVTDVARFLQAMGARIEGVGSPTLVVEGVSRLAGAEYRVMPDRIEAGTFLVAAAITGGEVLVTGADARVLAAPLDVLTRMGVVVERRPHGLFVRASSRRHDPVDVTTLPYPGFPTDLQAQFMALLCLADGNSFVTEKIYPERFMHVPELQRMGARIRKEGHSAIVAGVPSLSGCPVMASDLRASAALVLAGLAAQGETLVERVYHIDRGFAAIEARLGALGAKIRRVAGEGG